MPKYPVLKPKEVVRILNLLGFKEHRQRGSHKQFQSIDGRTTTVPIHPGRDISPILLKKILQDIKIDLEDFRKYI